MPQQQIPWWMQYYQGQASSPPPADPNFRTRLGPEAGGGTFASIGATSPTQTSSRAQGPPATQDFSGGGVDIPPATDFNPNTSYGGWESTLASPPPQPFTHLMSGTPVAGVPTVPYVSYGGWNPPTPDNPPPSETMAPTPVDQYLYNPPPSEGVTPPETQTYFGGGLNPPPNEAMMPNPVDQYIPGQAVNPLPNEAMIPSEAPTWQQPGLSNPPPNEQMIANPVSPDQSGLSLSSTPDLSIGSGDIQPLNYYPDGSGGYVVYDQNWNVVNNMPGTGSSGPVDTTSAGLAQEQTPSTIATGADTIIPTDTGTSAQNIPATPDTTDTSQASTGPYGLSFNPPGAPSNTYYPDQSYFGSLPGGTSGLGSFGPGNLSGVGGGVYGIDHTALLSWVQSQGYQNIGQWLAANPTGPGGSPIGGSVTGGPPVSAR